VLKHAVRKRETAKRLHGSDYDAGRTVVFASPVGKQVPKTKNSERNKTNIQGYRNREQRVPNFDELGSVRTVHMNTRGKQVGRRDCGNVSGGGRRSEGT